MCSAIVLSVFQPSSTPQKMSTDPAGYQKNTKPVMMLGCAEAAGAQKQRDKVLYLTPSCWSRRCSTVQVVDWCQSDVAGTSTGTIMTYQILARVWNSADVHRLPVNGVDEASLGHSDGTDDMDPAGSGVRRQWQILTSKTDGTDIRQKKNIEKEKRKKKTPKKNPTNRLSVVVFKAPPRRLQRQHSYRKRHNKGDGLALKTQANDFEH